MVLITVSAEALGAEEVRYPVDIGQVRPLMAVSYPNIKTVPNIAAKPERAIGGVDVAQIDIPVIETIFRQQAIRSNRNELRCNGPFVFHPLESDVVAWDA